MKLSMALYMDSQEPHEQEPKDSKEEIEDYNKMVRDSLAPVPFSWNSFIRKYS